MLHVQPVSESETEDDPPQQSNLSPLPDRIGFIGAGQVCQVMLIMGNLRFSVGCAPQKQLQGTD